jgi:cAMP-binding proteins - catabolite gene activator and regulatory subunit of cAMP-dependent protein kinases
MNEQTQIILPLLREVPLFSGLSIEELEGLSEAFVRVELPKGETLYAAREATDGLFVIDSGQLELLDEDGRQLDVLKHAEVIGTEALNYLPIRQKTAVALTDVQVYFLPNKQIQALYAGVPAFKETASVLFNSVRLSSNIPMAWLEPGEKVYLMARKHPVFLLFRSIPPILTFGALWLLMVFLSSEHAFWSLAGLVAGFLFCLLWLVWNINNWANDFYLITSRRMVWVEHVTGFYDSRQEAPLSTLISVGIKTTQLGVFLGYSDVLVRTYIGDIRFERVAHARTIGKLIETNWARGKRTDLELDAREIRKALRQKFGKEAEDITAKDLQAELGTVQSAPREVNFFEWLFSDFVRIRHEVGGTITYRKHWLILLQKIILPLFMMVLSIIFMVAIITHNLTQVDYTMGLVAGYFLVFVAAGALVYQYVDWRNDLFQLTANQVIDLDRKPFGRESRRSAPLENILSIEYERRGLIPMLFNYGTVYITIGNSQLTFNDVYQPSVVQQDIFTRMGQHAQERDERNTMQERERVAQWFKVFQEEAEQGLTLPPQSEPTRPVSMHLPQ